MNRFALLGPGSRRPNPDWDDSDEESYDEWHKELDENNDYRPKEQSGSSYWDEDYNDSSEDNDD